jgi:hypothetical protein
MTRTFDGGETYRYKSSAFPFASATTVDATLAASQPNYAPAKAGDAMTLTSAYDAAKTAAPTVDAIDTQLSSTHGSGTWGSGSGGSGARTVVITVTDADDVALQGVSVRASQSNVSKGEGVTDVSGQATLNLDDGSYVIALTDGGVHAFGGATLVVNGDEAQTYEMSTNLVSPSAAGFVTGYWTCYGTNGAIEAGTTHYIQIQYGPGTAGLSHDSTIRTAVSASDGLVQFAGIPWGATVRVKRGTGNWIGGDPEYTAPTSGTTWAMGEVLGTP